MSQISDFFWWLFNTRPGVLTLLGAGIPIFLILALILEKKTRSQYHNHIVPEDQRSVFDDDTVEVAEAQWEAEKQERRKKRKQSHTN